MPVASSGLVLSLLLSCNSPRSKKCRECAGSGLTWSIQRRTKRQQAAANCKACSGTGKTRNTEFAVLADSPQNQTLELCAATIGHEDGFAKALKIASRRARINKRLTAHSFRHGFATSYLSAGGTIQELKELMGHSNISTTETYLHCLPQLASRVSSPLDTIIPAFAERA